MTAAKWLHSGMAGAPTLNGLAGSGITVLDAALKDGFGLKSVDSLSVASGVATLTISGGHAFELHQVVLVAGATPAALNGEQRVTAVTPTALSFAAPGVADQIATGSITVKTAPLGWLKVFSDTTLAAYKLSAPEASGHLLRVDDSAGQDLRVRMFEAMTGISTGQGLAPTDAQVSGGLYWGKSSAADASARKWAVYGDDRIAYVCLAPNSSYPDNFQVWVFGDPINWRPSDPYGCVISGSESSAHSAGSVLFGCAGYSSPSAARVYFSRALSGLGASAQATKIGSGAVGTASGAYSGAAGYCSPQPAFPNEADYSLLTAPVLLRSGGSYRSTLPGLHHCPQDLSTAFAGGELQDGKGATAGRKLRAQRVGGPGSSAFGIVFFDITGPWR